MYVMPFYWFSITTFLPLRLNTKFQMILLSFWFPTCGCHIGKVSQRMMGVCTCRERMESKHVRDRCPLLSLLSLRPNCLKRVQFLQQIWKLCIVKAIIKTHEENMLQTVNSFLKNELMCIICTSLFWYSLSKKRVTFVWITNLRQVEGPSLVICKLFFPFCW